MTSAEDGGDLLAEGSDDSQDVQDVLGARIGLALVSGLGAVLGAATCIGLWLFYPPVRGEHWPMPVIGVASALVLIAGYATLRRRIGPVVADWFVLGYVVALIGMVAALTGGRVVEFVRERIEAVRDV